MKRSRVLSVYFPVFGNYETRVIQSPSIQRTGKRLGVKLSGCYGAFVSWSATPMYGVIVLGEKPSPDTIAHESAHAVRHLFDTVGADLEDETFAYHIGYLVGRIHKFVSV